MALFCQFFSDFVSVCIFYEGKGLLGQSVWGQLVENTVSEGRVNKEGATGAW